MRSHFPKVLFFGTMVLLLIVDVLSFTLSFGAVQGSGPRVPMQVILSFIVLIAALYVVLSRKYDESAQKWAYGAIGMILGFWLGIPQ